MTWTPGEPIKSDAVAFDSSLTIVKSDTVVFPRPIRALYVGGTGDVAVRMYGDQTTPIFKAVPVGAVLPISADQVLSTGTTATLLVGIF